MFSGLLDTSFFEMLRNILDILALSGIFFYFYRLLHAAKSSFFLPKLVAIVAVYAFASLLDLRVVLWLFKSVIGWIIFGVLVIFQPELRAIFSGANYSSVFLTGRRKTFILPDFEKIAKSVAYLIEARRGALLVFPRKMGVEEVIISKVNIDAKLSLELLSTIFSHDTILHDGAVVIHNNRILYAGCFLPTDYGMKVPSHLGSRHRAALGMTQNSDAVVMVLSEQTGAISVVFGSTLLYDIGLDKANMYIQQLLEDESLEINVDESTTTGYPTAIEDVS